MGYDSRMAPGSTKAEVTFARLQADIISGKLAPGRRLRYSELCEEYQTSMGVLRESMLRLVEQGLVQASPWQGFRVMPLSIDDLRDLTDTRLEIEALTLQWALTDGDLSWEGQLMAAHHKLSRTPQFSAEDPERLNEDWAGAHNDFHNVLLDACHIRRLKVIAASLRDAAGLYWRWYLPRQRDISGEHAALLNAVLERDKEVAVPLLREHIEATTTAITEAMRADPPEP